MLWLISLAAPSFAMQNNHDQCMEAAGGVTVDMLDCTSTALQQAEEDLSAQYERTIQEIEPETGTRLGISRQHWMAYRESTCDAEAAAASGGSFSSVARLDCLLRLTRDRLQWLKIAFTNPDIQRDQR
ncbi:lysozyme inhibitor LprI family protein [Aureimonas fodinaquatilis]|uniref:lysozyme inhibitor LprI family protein n=1 Tax=Aureimonas fodinaquatilis TaxID=2565783 RepID=UPI00165D4C68|nr:lysozyme inhibitor LprI family protein [Aureimonas fodinaquatilis]